MNITERENAIVYINKQRKKGRTDDEIKTKLHTAAWSEEAITEAFAAANDPDLPPPAPTASSGLLSSPTQPIAVTQRFTTRGLEYNIMVIALAFAAISLGICLHYFANAAFGATASSWESEYVAAAASALLVSLPIFILLFRRLHKAETAQSSLRQDSTRRRAIQVTLIVSFIWGISKIISTLYLLLSGKFVSEVTRCSDYYTSQDCTAGLSETTYIILQLIHLVITLGIAGGIFAYYWIDEHRKDQQ